jgi:hypothetical protein
MVTLEMVPLRSTLPTGRVTLRHAMPAFNPVLPDDLMTRIEDVLTAHDTAAHDTAADDAGAHETSTTPQVGPEGASPEVETTAGKGGGAR